MNYYVRVLFAVLTLTALAGNRTYTHAQTPTFDRAIACANSPDGYGWGPKQVAVDGQGNTLMTGQFSGSIVLGSTILTAAGANSTPGFPITDVFVAKLNAAGNYVWATQVSGTLLEYVSGIAVDAAGDVYMSGNFESYSISFGNITLYNSSAAGETYVAKLSGTTGQWLWAKRCGGIGDDNGTSVAVNAQGEVYLAGYMAGGLTDYGPYTLPANGHAYLFLAKLNTAGTWLWAQQTATGGYPSLSGMVLDGQDNIYLAGSFDASGSGLFGSGTLAIGSTTLTANTPGNASAHPSGPGRDVFIAKFTASGTAIWATQGSPNGQNLVYNSGFAYDGLGHLYIVGSYNWQSASIGGILLPNVNAPYQIPSAPTGQFRCNPNVYIARLNATTGIWEWVIRAGGTQGDGISAVAADGQGRVYVSGYHIAGFANPLPGGGQVDLAQLDGATGRWRWGRPRVPLLAVQNLVLDNAGRLLVAGWFSSTTATFGAVTLAQQGGSTGTTGYLARLGAGPLATQGPTVRPDALQVWPNPSAGRAVQVQGPAPGQAVQVLDGLGRVVVTGHMPAQGVLSLALPATTAAGLYVVCSAGQARQLVVI